MAYALRAEPSRAGSSDHRPGCSAGQRDGSTVCRNECGIASGGPRNQQEGESFPAVTGGRWGLRVSLSLVWPGAQCRMKTWGPRLESRPRRPVNDRCSYPASPFLLHVSSARAWATVPVHFPYGAPGQRRTELGAPSDPAGLGPASGPGSRRRYRETRAVVVRKNVPAREGTALLRA